MAPTSRSKLGRLSRAAAAKESVGDNVELAAAILGPLHAFVCDNITTGITQYRLRFETLLPKRTVDVVVESLIACGLVVKRGLRLYHAIVASAAVKAFAGNKQAPLFLVYKGLARATPRSEQYYRRRRYSSRN